MVLTKDGPRYVQKEMVFECTRNSNHVMVVELNCHLFYKHNNVYKRLVHELPEFHNTILNQVVNKKLVLVPGQCVFLKVKGYNICGLINRSSFSDNEESVDAFTSWALKSMQQKLGKDKIYFSGILKDGYNSLHKYVTEHKLKWNIFYE